MSLQTISHFELLNKLGEGGMGTVYKARDVRLDRVVALKFLSSRNVSPEQQARFLQEGRALSALSHPHVATVYEVDEMDGAPFLALEYLPGGTLRSRIKLSGGRLPVTSIIGWGADLAEGLAHVHRHGIVHRDVTSSNVMFDAEGRLKLTDFGLAQVVRSDQSATGNRIQGTIGYLSPEQLLGRPADSRSDLYSLGVLLYEMATGQLPCEGKDTQEVIRRTISEEPRPLRKLRPDLPAGLENIANRLLEKRPENRFARAEDVAFALRELQPATADDQLTETVLDVPTSGRRISRRWWFFLAAACVALIAIGTSAGVLRRWSWKWGLPDRKNVAVLPFRSIGGDDEQRAFCDGITETLTSALTKHGGFSVVPAMDARRLESTSQARRDFGVNLIISGSVQRREDYVRVIVTLIDAGRQRQMESEPIDWPVSKLYQMEDAVLGKISDLLAVTAVEPPGSFAAVASQLPSAYDAYLRGRGYLFRYDRAGNLDRARTQFELAIRQDARFALAYIGLAEAHLQNYRSRKDALYLEAGREMAAKSVELNSRLAGGHVSLGAILAEMRQPEQAIRELEAALKLDPREPVAYRELANVYRSQKRFGEAEQVYLRAISTRPGDWQGYSNLGVFYASQQRNADAERMFRKVIEVTPDNHIGYRNLGSLLIRLGRNNREAEDLCRKAIALKPTGKAYSNLGALLMFQQRYREAVDATKRAVELSAQETPGDYMPFGNLGDALQLAGEPIEQARQAWRQAIGILEIRLRQAKDDPEMLATRGMYRAKAGERADAAADAERAILLAPENATVHYLAALAFAVNGSNPGRWKRSAPR